MTETQSRLAAALADRYRIVRELGQGGMATVYLARDLKHDRDVALKVLKPELAAVIGGERFLAEIKTTANLQHPHILALFDSGAVDGTVFYAMPYVDGESLRDRLAREKHLPINDAVRIATEVADALEYAHHHGVIHRDIKPENILLNGGHALVVDFGIALAASHTGGRRMTETGMSLGTPTYMSPEQAMGERTLDARTDIYALGCVLYEMLVGDPPHVGSTAQAIVAKVLTEKPSSIVAQRDRVPPHVEDAVLTALAKLPADRFASAADFAAALAGQDMMRGAPRVSRRVSEGGAVWRRRFQIASAVALVALVLGGWGWIRARAAARQPVARNYIFLGDSVQVQVAGGLALSPDGEHLAFIGEERDRIWIKRRQDLSPVVLLGTDHASGPVFSPDGKWIAYLADSRLKKVRVEGGASVTIADSASSYLGGAAWLDDNTLVFVESSLLGLRRVNANGGRVEVVVSDSSFAGFGLGLLTPLPGARGVLFEVCTSGCVDFALHVLDLRTGRQHSLLKDVAMGWYLPSGHLLYLRRDGVALVAPFDLATLEISGASVPVLEDVMQRSVQAQQLAFSASGTLVYRVGGRDQDFLTLQRTTRNGVAVSVDSAWSGRFNSLALSPDGRRVAVGANTEGAGLNVWIKQLDTGPFTRLTFGGRDRRPAWSPDGRQVAFVRDSSNGGDVFTQPVDGGGRERRLVHLDRPVQEVQWSRDGQWVVLRTETGAAGNGDVVAVRTSGDTTVLPLAASSFTEKNPAFSPDGRWVAYTSNESGTDEVFVRPFPNAPSGQWQVSNEGGASPVWSTDGKELFFIAASGRLIAAQIAPGPAFMVKERRPLFDASRFLFDGYHQLFDVTRDGRFIFLSSSSLGGDGSQRLVQVDNWFADVKSRLAP